MSWSLPLLFFRLDKYCDISARPGWLNALQHTLFLCNAPLSLNNFCRGWSDFLVAEHMYLLSIFSSILTMCDMATALSLSAESNNIFLSGSKYPPTPCITLNENTSSDRYIFLMTSPIDDMSYVILENVAFATE